MPSFCTFKDGRRGVLWKGICEKIFKQYKIVITSWPYFMKKSTICAKPFRHDNIIVSISLQNTWTRYNCSNPLKQFKATLNWGQHWTITKQINNKYQNTQSQNHLGHYKITSSLPIRSLQHQKQYSTNHTYHNSNLWSAPIPLLLNLSYCYIYPKKISRSEISSLTISQTKKSKGKRKISWTINFRTNN